MKLSQPDQALAIRDFFLPSIEAEHRVTRSIIKAVPADKLDFKLSPAGKSLAQLLWHLVGTEHLYLTGICEARIPAAPESPAATPEAILAWDDQHFPQLLQRLTALTGEDLLRPVEFLGQTKPVIEFLPVYTSAVLQNRGLLLAYVTAVSAQKESLLPAQPKEAQPAPTGLGELNEEELAAAVGGGTFSTTISQPVQVVVTHDNEPNQAALYAQQHPNSGLLGLYQGGTPSQVIGVALGGTAVGFGVTGGAVTAAIAAGEKSAQALVLASETAGLI